MKEPLSAMAELDETFRALLENGILRLKQCKHGPMMFFAGDTHIGRSLDLYGELSEPEIELFRRYLRPGMVAVDVGANIGTHTVCFAQSVGPSGRVFAFEPQSMLHQVLRGNVALNACRNVVAENKALGARPGSIIVPWLDYAREGNFGALELGAWTQGETIALAPLDSYALDPCHLIKIDAEGVERDVLEGASATVARHQPLLYVENNKPERSKELIQWLLANHYRLYWHLPPLFNPTNYFGEMKNVFGITISVNMLCVPKSKPSRVEGLREITSPDDRWYSD
jgi:FkbM family methyltransferase